MRFILPTQNRRQAKAVLNNHASTRGALCSSGNASTCSVITMQITENNEVEVTSNYFSSPISIAEYGVFSQKWEKWIKENV